MLDPYAPKPITNDSQRYKPASVNWTFVLLVAFGLWFAYYTQKEGIPDHNFIDDDPVITDDEKEDREPAPDPNKNKLPFKDCYLVRVYETEADKVPIWMLKFLNNNDTFWIDWLKEDKGATFFSYDPDNEQSKSFISAAKKNGVDVPFFLLASSGETIDVIPFEESLTVEDLKERLLTKAE